MNDLPEPSAPNPIVNDALRALVEEYAERLRAGEEPDRYAFLRRRPDLAALLEHHLETAENLFVLGRSCGAAAHGLAETPACIGRYRIDGVLGRGAFSVVYRAFDPKHERAVALKVLHVRPADEHGRPDRFHRDALIAARLRHPNIVPLHDTGEHAGLRYLDMELIDGETLEQRLQRTPGPYEARAAAGLVRTVAIALDYAHRQGVVHRDVKPSNILLGADGDPQLTDFDLASEVGAQSLTAHGQLLGTPSYMSPEQAEGRAHQADARSDVYSLGVVLYRLLTGRLPFDETRSLTVLLADIVRREPARPRALHPTVPCDLERICLKALEKSPGDRFGSAEIFADELGRFQRDEPLQFRPPSPGERLRRWVRRNPAAAGLLGVALLLVATLAVLSWAEYRRGFEAAVRTQLEQQNDGLRGQMADEVERALLRSAKLRLQVAAAGRRQEAQELLRAAAAARARFSTAAMPEEARLELRSLFALSLAFPDVKLAESADLPNNGFILWPVAMHPDGDRLVVGTPAGPSTWKRGERLVAPAKADRDRPRPHPYFSPDGRWLVLTRAEGGLALYDGRAVEQPLAQVPGDRVLGAGFDGRGAVVACDDHGLVTTYALPGLVPGRSWHVGERLPALSAAAVGAGANRVAVGTSSGRAAWFAADGRRLGEGTAAASAVDALAWSPDGQTLAIGTRNGTVQLWDADGKPRQHFNYSNAGVGRLCFSPDGHYILAGQRFNYTRGWDARTGQDALVCRLPVWGFSRDGLRLASGGSGQVAYYEWLPTEGLEHLAGHRASVARTVWSRDGRCLASVDADGAIFVWDVATRLPVRSLTGPPPGFHSENAGLALSDDGARLAYAPGGKQSQLLLYDVKTGTTLERWPLPEGYDRLVCVGGERFLSVREERLAGDKATRSVVRTLADRQLSPPVVLRAAMPGDHGFYELNVTSDGKRCAWSGPRDPPDHLRVEVHDLENRRLLQRIPLRPQRHVWHYVANLSHGGRFLWYFDDRGTRRLDVDSGTSAEIPELPQNISEAGGWLLLTRPNPLVPNNIAIVLQAAAETRPWLRLINPGEDALASSNIQFDPRGRYLVWGGLGGSLTLADLDVLKAKVSAFERSVAAP